VLQFIAAEALDRFPGRNVIHESAATEATTLGITTAESASLLETA
jgi:hypothetical protein